MRVVIYRRGQPQRKLPGAAFMQPLEEVPAAKRDVAVVAADLRLLPFGDRMALFVDAQVHDRLTPALADGLQFNELVRERQKRRRAGE